MNFQKYTILKAHENFATGAMVNDHSSESLHGADCQVNAVTASNFQRSCVRFSQAGVRKLTPISFHFTLIGIENPTLHEEQMMITTVVSKWRAVYERNTV